MNEGKILENYVHAWHQINTLVQNNEQLHFAGAQTPHIILVHINELIHSLHLSQTLRQSQKLQSTR